MRQLLLMHEGEQAGRASGSWVAAAPSWAGLGVRAYWPPLRPPPTPPACLGRTRGSAEWYGPAR